MSNSNNAPAAFATLLAIREGCRDFIVDACAEQEVDFEIGWEAALRYLARAATGRNCEDSDLLVAVANNNPAPSPFDGRVFAAVTDALDHVVVWVDDQGDDGRFALDPELFRRAA